MQQFSCRETGAENVLATESVTSAAKAALILLGSCGAAEAVPFQNRSFPIGSVRYD
jgi:hypothetical protein